MKERFDSAIFVGWLRRLSGTEDHLYEYIWSLVELKLFVYRVAVGVVPFFDPNCSSLPSYLYTRWQRFKWFSEAINRQRRSRFLSKFCMNLLSHQFTKESNHLRNSAENNRLLHIHVIYSQKRVSMKQYLIGTSTLTYYTKVNENCVCNYGR